MFSQNVWFKPLDGDIGHSSQDVEYVDVVPWVLKVLKSLVSELKTVVDDRKDNANQHHPAHVHSVLVVAVQEDFIDVCNEECNVDEVNDCSEVMNVLGVVVPVEVVEVLQYLGVEQLELPAVLKGIHQIVDLGAVTVVVVGGKWK